MGGRKKVTAPVNNPGSWKKDFQKNGVIYLIFLPIAAYFIIFNYVPMVGTLMAFENYKPTKGLFGSDWVGFANFAKLFSGKDFPRAFRNTAVMAVMSILLGFLPPIILAILFSECKVRKYRRVTQIMSYMPNFVSTVVVCAIVTEFVSADGPITHFLMNFGVKQQNLLASNQEPVFKLIYCFIGVWAGFGYGSIIYTTAISNVSGDLKEAAALDGANRFQRIWYIVLPSLKHLVIMQLTMAVGTMFMVGFDKVLLLYIPKNYEVSDVLYTYTYRMAFGNRVDYGVSTASSLFQSILGTVLLIVSNQLSKRLAKYSLF